MNIDVVMLERLLNEGVPFAEAKERARITRGSGPKPDMGPLMSALSGLVTEIGSPAGLLKATVESWPHQGYRPVFTAKTTDKTGHYAEWQTVEGEATLDYLIDQLHSYFVDRIDYLNEHPEIRGRDTKLEKAERGLANLPAPA